MSNFPQSTPKSIPSTSIESQEIEKLLIAAIDTGELVSYEELSKAAGGDVRTNKRWALNTARKALLRDHQVWFQVVRKMGVRKATDPEIIAEAGQGMKTVHRRLGRDLRKLAAVADYDSLSDQQKVLYNAKISQIGILYHISKSTKIKQIESKVEEASRKLSLPETFALFTKKPEPVKVEE